MLFARKPRSAPSPPYSLPVSTVTAITCGGSRRSGARGALAEHIVVASTGGKGVDLDQIKQLFPDAVVDPGRPVALADLSNEVDLSVASEAEAFSGQGPRQRQRASCPQGGLLGPRRPKPRRNHDHDH